MMACFHYFSVQLTGKTIKKIVYILDHLKYKGFSAIVLMVLAPLSSLFFFSFFPPKELGPALVEQLGVGDDGRWYQQLVITWHWYLPLGIKYLKTKQNKNTLLYYFNLVLIKMERSMLPACSSVMCFFNKSNIKRTNSLKI